ncbi:MAG: diaminopimelate epimerase [Actinomycetales bacterium]|nr:diaminopimelate epimerase [Actinomycetales bacterium]
MTDTPATDVSAAPLAYLKADGTGNDFIVLLDPDDTLTLEPASIVAWCNRHTGIGADGVLRILRRSDGSFFMDYRNADGTVAETCGNGLRVVAHVLRRAGLIAPGAHTIGTRGGDVRVRVPDAGDITVSMGVAVTLTDALVVRPALGSCLPAIAVLMPNPHAVAFVDDLQALQLGTSPTHTPVAALPDGANYEFVHARTADHIRMRVFERGVGETLSCGSGACAAAVVAAQRAGAVAPWRMRVDVPGGTLWVDQDAGGVVSLTGPAQVTAEGVLPGAVPTEPQTSFAAPDAHLAQLDPARPGTAVTEPSSAGQFGDSGTVEPDSAGGKR